MDFLLKFLFPERCIACRTEGALLCEKCELISKPKTYDSDPFEKIFIGTNYHGVVKKAIQCFKYSFFKKLSNPLGNLIQKSIPEDLKNTCFIPIPLHWSRKFYRGFNQAELLTTSISPNSCNLLIRSKKTKSQALQSRETRLQNLENAFQINQKIKNPPPLTQPIILIDDVATTFSTLSSAAKCLKKSGYTRIFGAAIAHGK
jgi:ComF family protein